MSSMRLPAIALALTIGLGSSFAAQSTHTEWSRFRGPNGSGHATGNRYPTEFGATKHLLW